MHFWGVLEPGESVYPSAVTVHKESRTTRRCNTDIGKDGSLQNSWEEKWPGEVSQRSPGIRGGLWEVLELLHTQQLLFWRKKGTSCKNIHGLLKYLAMISKGVCEMSTLAAGSSFMHLGCLPSAGRLPKYSKTPRLLSCCHMFKFPHLSTYSSIMAHAPKLACYINSVPWSHPGR